MALLWRLGGFYRLNVYGTAQSKCYRAFPRHRASPQGTPPFLKRRKVYISEGRNGEFRGLHLPPILCHVNWPQCAVLQSRALQECSAFLWDRILHPVRQPLSSRQNQYTPPRALGSRSHTDCMGKSRYLGTCILRSGYVCMCAEIFVGQALAFSCGFSVSRRTLL